MGALFHQSSLPCHWVIHKVSINSPDLKYFYQIDNKNDLCRDITIFVLNRLTFLCVLVSVLVRLMSHDSLSLLLFFLSLNAHCVFLHHNKPVKICVPQLATLCPSCYFYSNNLLICLLWKKVYQVKVYHTGPRNQNYKFGNSC